LPSRTARALHELDALVATPAPTRDAFGCVPRGPVKVEGRGDGEAWFLIGRRETPALPASVASVAPTGIGATR
jgi:hypothetical protein